MSTTKVPARFTPGPVSEPPGSHNQTVGGRYL
jgi:hypothetical protein